MTLYETMGRLHAAAVVRECRPAGERGQGTVEYVGLVLLVAIILAGVVKATDGTLDSGIATTIVEKLKDAIDDVGGKK